MQLRSWKRTAFLLGIAGWIAADGVSASAHTQFGSGGVSGVVVNAADGAPVSQATVLLIGPIGSKTQDVWASPEARARAQAPEPASRSAMTSADGTFVIDGLTPGRYTATVLTQRGHALTDGAATVAVTANAIASVTIKLSPKGAVTGRVVGESGEPVAGAHVTALASDGSAFVAVLGRRATTDDLGRFRLFNLLPGAYYIHADPPAGSFAPSSYPRQGQTGTFYPAATLRTDAQAIVVLPGQETSSIDILLSFVRLARVHGVARDSSGRTLPPGASGVTLVPAANDARTALRSSSVQFNGTFVIENVPPGDFYLYASTAGRTGRESAYLPVVVRSQDVQVDIRTNLGATLRGQVVVQGTLAPVPATLAGGDRSGASRVTVRLTPVGATTLPGVVGNPAPAPVAADGSFQLTGVRGSVVLTASSTRGGIVKSISSGGVDISGRPLTLEGTEEINDLLIVLTTETGRLDGTVVSDPNRPASGGYVLVLPDDEDRWFDGSPFVHVVRPARTADASSFVVPRLLPGRYLVVAVSEQPPAGLSTHERHDWLRGLANHAQPITITAHATAVVHNLLIQER
jgi:hypothetical protein